MLVSAKFRRAVAAARLSGIEFREALEFRPKFGTPALRQFAEECAADYRAVWVTGLASIEVTCGVRIAKDCKVCGWVEWTLPRNGIIIEEQFWDGSDFFQLRELPGPMFMTERAAHVLSNAGLSNFACKPAHEHWPGRIP